MESNKLKRFTYGHQFEPAKFSLVEILELCKECQPSRDTLEANIALSTERLGESLRRKNLMCLTKS